MQPSEKREIILVAFLDQWNFLARYSVVCNGPDQRPRASQKTKNSLALSGSSSRGALHKNASVLELISIFLETGHQSELQRSSNDANCACLVANCLLKIGSPQALDSILPRKSRYRRVG